MKIKNHIWKIIAVAFIVLSLSLTFPTISYAETDTNTGKPSVVCGTVPEISKEYILTNVGSAKVDKLLSKYKPGTFFSGVYNIPTKTWMALPSEGASLISMSNDKICTVKPNGGHDQVKERFKTELNNLKPLEFKSADILGFGIKIPTDSNGKVLSLEFKSGLNCCSDRQEKPNRILVNPELRRAIKEAVKKAATGYTVEIAQQEEYSACKENHLSKCDIVIPKTET